MPSPTVMPMYVVQRMPRIAATMRERSDRSTFTAST